MWRFGGIFLKRIKRYDSKNTKPLMILFEEAPYG
jgi:hypothetical protein